MIGTWFVNSTPANVPNPKIPSHDCTLVINADGSFQAQNFPLVIDFLPKLAVNWVTEHGIWNLTENRATNARSRWKLKLVFSSSHFETSLDLTGSPTALRLFAPTDLDSWVGFELAPTRNSSQ